MRRIITVFGKKQQWRGLLAQEDVEKKPEIPTHGKNSIAAAFERAEAKREKRKRP